MAFHFRLQRLLKYRRFLLDQAQLEFLAADRRRREIEREKRLLKEVIVEYRRRWKVAQQEGMDVASFLSYREYLESLEARLPNLEKRLQEARKEVEKHRLIVLEREKDVKMLEKLRDRHREQAELEMRRKDQKVLDEIVVLRSNRESYE